MISRRPANLIWLNQCELDIIERSTTSENGLRSDKEPAKELKADGMYVTA